MEKLIQFITLMAEHQEEDIIVSVSDHKDIGICAARKGEGDPEIWIDVAMAKQVNQALADAIDFVEGKIE